MSHPLPPFPYVQMKWIFHIRAELSVGIIVIYGIGSHISYPHIREFLLHANTAFKLYTLIEGLEGGMFDKRYAIYLYVVNLRTELDGFGFLASDDGTYIISVNADDTVTDFPPFKISFSCTRTFLIMERRFW